MPEYVRGEVTPPADHLRDALELVDTGRFAGHPDPDSALLDLPAKQCSAILYAVDRGLVGQDELTLTDAGRRVLAILGGERG